MFPIWNTSSKVVGFGGRVFASDDPAKYMNSPETPLYKKVISFTGFIAQENPLEKKKYAILVEGYTDVIKLSQSGVQNCVAVSGTAFSDRHASQMKRFCSRVLLAYDGDSAGVAATIKLAMLLPGAVLSQKSFKFQIKKILMSGYLKSEGMVLLKKALKKRWAA